MYEYAKTNNLSYHDIYQELVKELLQTWNVSEAVDKFYESRAENIRNISNTTVEFENNEEWSYFHAIRQYSVEMDKKFDWFPEKIGSFFVNKILHYLKSQMYYKNKPKIIEKILQIADGLHEAFTIPGMNISLINLAHLHTINDFRQLLAFEDLGYMVGYSGWGKVSLTDYLANFPSSFYDCFKEERSYMEQNDSEEPSNEPYIMKSPCMENRHVEICKEYCEWSNKSQWSDFFSKKEFYSLMRYALPQGKIVMKQDESELNVVKTLVGHEGTGKKPIIAPVPLVIFCKYLKNQPWIGQDIGMDAKVCDDFEQIPSDVGICVSRGIDATRIFKNQEFGNGQKSKKMKGGMYSGVATFFLDTDNVKTSQLYKRTIDSPLDSIQMQIHSGNEMAQILYDKRQDHNTRSFTLKRGYEYTFEVSIDGQVLRKNFHELPMGKRNCRLPNEVEEKSWFNSYSKQNCKHQCRTLIAYKQCGCIPWDIYHFGNYNECDVFGRTCFMNAMKNITHAGDLCHGCDDDCQYLRYRFKLKRTEKIFTEGYEDGKYAAFDPFDDNKECIGMNAICKYLQDKNLTLDDKYYIKEKSVDDMVEKHNGLIVVNIIFASSVVDLTVLDVRYTLIDKITSLGGSIGLFTQFTGCSIIAIIHLAILMIKSICMLIKNFKEKFFSSR